MDLYVEKKEQRTQGVEKFFEFYLGRHEIEPVLISSYVKIVIQARFYAEILEAKGIHSLPARSLAVNYGAFEPLEHHDIAFVSEF